MGCVNDFFANEIGCEQHTDVNAVLNSVGIDNK